MTIQFNFDNSYARQLEGFYVPWQGAAVSAPAIVRINDALARQLQIDPSALHSAEGAAILAGALTPAGATPLAQAYAGHQFGGFSPQLGDGRALLVGELIDSQGQRRDLHLKGSGRTPFSRGGDGKAVLGPVLREYLLGETIDYGPCAFIDAYDRNAVFSSIDRQGRYAFGAQPTIAQWNLARLAETLLPLINDDADEAIRIATNEVKAFGEEYTTCWLEAMRAKLGLVTASAHDLDLVNALYEALEGQQVDFTQLFRSLATAVLGNSAPARLLFVDETKFAAWLAHWQERINSEAILPEMRAQAMNAINPIYIPRNHKVEEALQAAVVGDLTKFEKLLTVLANPFAEQVGFDDYAEPAPAEFGPYTTFCGT